MFGFRIGLWNVLQIYRGGHPPHQTEAKLCKDDTETTQKLIHAPPTPEPKRPEILFYCKKKTKNTSVKIKTMEAKPFLHCCRKCGSR